MGSRAVLFSVHPHNAKVGPYPWLRWYADHLERGPHGRRHNRRVTAWMLGWQHEQNETESGDEVSACPWTKRTYVREYESGRREWRRAKGKEVTCV